VCGRFYVPEEHDDVFDAVLDQIRSRSGEKTVLQAVKRGEVFPSEIVPAVTAAGPLLMKWGFSLPTGRGLVINARLETAGEKTLFRQPFSACRCLLPAGHYFEWKNEGAAKEKYAVGRRTILYMAGLYRWTDAASVPQFVILTCPAVPRFASIHERMPVTLPEAARAAWLFGRLNAADTAEIAAEDAESLRALPA
jgi:putative SOS response-associated peptidase YedK